jgi:hypothetical protein
MARSVETVTQFLLTTSASVNASLAGVARLVTRRNLVKRNVLVQNQVLSAADSTVAIQSGQSRVANADAGVHGVDLTAARELQTAILHVRRTSLVYLVVKERTGVELPHLLMASVSASARSHGVELHVTKRLPDAATAIVTRMEESVVVSSKGSVNITRRVQASVVANQAGAAMHARRNARRIKRTRPSVL